MTRPVHGGTHLRLATYNLDNGRNRKVVRDEVVEAFERFGLDAMACQEGKGYWRTLRRRGRVILPRQWMPRWRDCYLAVARGVAADHVAAHAMRRGWERAPGNRRLGLHPARVLNVYKVEWLDRLAAVHMPPTPQSERHPFIAKAYPKRDAAWQEYLDVLETLCLTWNARDLRWVLDGDFNIPADDPRIEDFARRVGGVIFGRGIDYFILGPGIGGSHVERKRHGNGDHGHLSLIDIHLTGDPS